MLIVMIEHIIIVFKYFISAMINDKPSWVTAEERERSERLEAIRVILDMKREDMKNRGEVPLDEIIEMMKLTQSKQPRKDENYDDKTVGKLHKLEKQMRKKLVMQQRVSL